MNNQIVVHSNNTIEFNFVNKELKTLAPVIPNLELSFWLENSNKISVGNDSLNSERAIAAFLSHFTPIQQLLYKSDGKVLEVLKYASTDKINSLIKEREKQLILEKGEKLELYTKEIINFKAFVNTSLQERIIKFALVYLGQSTDRYDSTTLEILGGYIKNLMQTEFRDFSLYEVDLAFQDFVKKEGYFFNGAFDGKLFYSIMNAYKAKRNRFIDFIENGVQRKLFIEGELQDKNAKAYSEFLQEFEQLKIKNTKYQSFIDCPIAFVSRLIDDNIISYTKEEHDEMKVVAHSAAFMDLRASCMNTMNAQRKFKAFVYDNLKHLVKPQWLKAQYVALKTDDYNLIVSHCIDEIVKRAVRIGVPNMRKNAIAEPLVPVGEFVNLFKQLRINYMKKLYFFSAIAPFEDNL